MKVRDYYLIARNRLLNEMTEASHSLRVGAYCPVIALAERTKDGVHTLPVSFESFRGNTFAMPSFNVIISAAGNYIVNQYHDVALGTSCPQVPPLVPDYLTRVTMSITHKNENERQSWYNWATYDSGNPKVGRLFTNEFLDMQWDDSWMTLTIMFISDDGEQEVLLPDDTNPYDTSNTRDSHVHTHTTTESYERMVPQSIESSRLDYPAFTDDTINTNNNSLGITLANCFDGTMSKYRASHPVIASLMVGGTNVLTTSVIASMNNWTVLHSYEWNTGCSRYELPIESPLPSSTYSLATVESLF